MKKLTCLTVTLLSSAISFSAFAGQLITSIAPSSSSFSCANYVAQKQQKLENFIQRKKIVIAPASVVVIAHLVIVDKQTRYKSALAYLEQLAAGKRDESITKLMNKHVKPAFALNSFQVSAYNQNVDTSEQACRKLYKSRGDEKRKDRILARAYKRVK